ncbi:MAG: MFS transporter, partial [Campylobacterota bacterium]|nr:MFS transporter [Campylobacterota bacterium]
MKLSESAQSVKPNQSEKKRIFWLMFALAVLSWISLKMVLPALPSLVEALHTSSSGVKLSVSIYLLFFAFSQLVWGVVIQKKGSRSTIYYSLSITLLGTLIAITSLNLPMYIAGRTLEGIGLGALGPVTRTVLVNYFDRKELSVRFSIIIGTAATMPALSPLFAGYLMVWINWQAIF